MKTFLSFLLLFCAISTKATNYYFSNLSGDDSRSPLAAQSPATPWKTLNKLNAIFSTLKPGDSLLLKRGDTFYGSIVAQKSGTSSAPIVIGAYGKGENPVITGLVPLSWNSAGSGLWTSNETLNLSALNMVTVNGSPVGMGRWPNLDNGNGGYDTIRSATAKSITDEVGLKSSPAPGKPTYFVGAEIVVRTTRWLLDRHPITQYDSRNSVITFDNSSTNETPSANKGYFIQDDSTVLDRQNEWWYNRTNKRLKMYSQNAPANVSAANLQNLFVSSDKSYITIDNITLNGCNGDAISLSKGSHIVVQNCFIRNIGRNAVITSSPDCSILNNTMLDIMSKGVLINPQADHTVVRYNTIRNVSQILGLGTSQQEDNRSSFSGDGVYIKEMGAVVEYNKFFKMGYSAVHLTKVDSVRISYNYIDTVCNVYDDGGAIYSYTGTAYTNHGRKISNNIILHGLGAFYGSGVRGGSAAGAGVAGIYNDRGSSDIDVDSNTVAYFEKGILENFGCNRIKMRHNTFYNNSNEIQINTRTKDKTRNLYIANNVALAATQSQKAIYIYSDDGDVLDKFGKIDSNYYSRPINDKVTMSWQTATGSKNMSVGSLSDWQTKFPMYDASSKKSPHTIANTSQFAFEYNPTNARKTVSLSGTYVDAKGNTYTGSVTLQPFHSMVLMRTGDNVQNAAPIVSLTSPAANVTFTTPASINIAASASDPDGSIARVEFYSGETLLGTNKTSPYTFKWDNVKPGSYALTAKAFDNSGFVTTSDTLIISVTNKQAATVSITSPGVNTSFKAPASINISASVDGAVSRVDFYNGTTLIGSDNSSPYSITWDNVAQGNYAITAKAVNDDGEDSYSSPVTVSVITEKSRIAPSVAITNPSAGSGLTSNANFVAPAVINITAAASDADGKIAKVEFFNGETLLKTEQNPPYTFTWNDVPAGNYTLIARATDNDGLVTTSSAVTFAVLRLKTAPVVSITSPAASTEFSGPASIKIAASAIDADGSVARVDFYNGNTLLGTATGKPYSFTWQNVPVGDYALTAVATDNDGIVTSSSAVTVSVKKPNVAPTVSITNSLSSAKFTAPASITLSAAATDADGSVVKVEFYNGSTLLGTATKSPYSFTWNNVPAGNYSFTAVATDNSGLTASSQAFTLAVSKPNVAPKVAITSPSSNAGFKASGSINIVASASDADGSVAKVDFYSGNTLLGTVTAKPYSFTWKNVPAGNFALTAKATDNSGLESSSSAVTVLVTKPNIPPTVSITSPSANTGFTAPASVTISAAAQDDDGSIAKVEFFNGSTLIKTENYFPYSFNLADAAVGSYTITAKATDNKGSVTVSKPVSFYVSKPNVAPTVSITSPSASAGFTAPAAINISAAAKDADGRIAKVEFYNGNTLLKTDISFPYAFTWNDAPAGNYTITAKATDNKGAVTTSQAISFSVVKPNAAPTVSLTSPSANAGFTLPASITISAAAVDNDGSIAKVEFFSGDTLIKTENYYPYSFTWNDASAGTHRLTAKATDNKGLSATSAVVSFTVIKPNVAPTVSITSPSANAGFTIPAAVNITAAAADSDGSIAKVEFFSGDTLIKTQYYSPYSFTWNDAPTGMHTLTAKATDNKGLVTTSSAVSFSVIKPNAAPSVSITSPTANADFKAPASVELTAVANDIDGSVAKVEFYDDTTLLTIERKAPYSWDWQNVPAGRHTITAIATDNAGRTTKSRSIVISVAGKVMPVVNIVTPANNAIYAADSTINMKANASYRKGTITKVEFYSGKTLVKTEYQAPYTNVWKNMQAGVYTFTVKAYSNDGLSSVSTPVTVIVSAPVPNDNNTAASGKGKRASRPGTTDTITHSVTNNEIMATNEQKIISKVQPEIIQPKAIDIAIGPNPASNMLSVFTNKLPKDRKVQISIFSMTGRLFKTLVSNSSTEVIHIDISSLTRGMYLLKLQTSDTSIYKQFEKQ